MVLHNDFELEIFKRHQELEVAQHLAQSRMRDCLQAQEKAWGRVNREGSIRDILSRFRGQPRPEAQPA
jgi:hypothetical protein